MTEQAANSQEDRTKQDERADRILDVASSLILRYGYKKTTIDDIAREAGVAKGTIYLHWKTKDDLFLSLLMREKIRGARMVEQEMSRDPDGNTLHGMMKYSLLMLLKHPLLRSAVLQDADILGELTQKELARTGIEEQLTAFYGLLEFFRKHELIRQDHPIQTQIYLLEALSIGFLMADKFLPEEFQVSSEEKALLMAETVKRTFALRNPTSDEQDNTLQQLHHVVDLAEKYMKKERTE
ncbi:TetR/AcrR family transcriptional regulator [Tengunoibacter tsumagoiensis]|uniref:TetR family transcriptional regulator n=1 Tax=Tengunoibacter tsumagoiensis TaxID=2014871 RepID=A0A402A4F8_9CHLR|nr:helix-turn-helix domain-containing protein [Tengunoibacter tsumagoiensis]GCE14044.1 TetR family transcriptional regulator [Tengunoibacter tsumagoiensis]